MKAGWLLVKLKARYRGAYLYSDPKTVNTRNKLT